MAKKNKNRNPVHIPNQPLFNNNGFNNNGHLFLGLIEGTLKEQSKEREIQKKLSLRNR